jgi:hypothetical protein
MLGFQCCGSEPGSRIKYFLSIDTVSGYGIRAEKKSGSGINILGSFFQELSNNL